MKFSPLSILAVLISTSFTSFSQTETFKGKVVDSVTNISLSGVSVQIGKFGTTTNSKGIFEIKADIKQIKDTAIIFSYIGYFQKRLYYQPGAFYVVKMVPGYNRLSDITITSGNGRQIVEKAIEKIPTNYPTKDFILYGITRQTQQDNDSDYYYRNDAVVKIYYPSYLQNGKAPSVQLVQNKPLLLKKPSYERNVKDVDGYLIVPSNDFVHNRADFISKRKMVDYKYSLKGEAFLKNKKVFVVDFYYKNNDSLSMGTIYIDTACYAFAAIKLTAYNVRRGFPFIPNKKENTYITYQQKGGKWYINDIRCSSYTTHSGANLQRNIDFSFLSLDTNKVVQLAYADIIQELDEDVRINKTGSDSSWLPYGSVFANAENDSLISNTPVPIIDTTVKKSVRPPKNRLLYNIARYMRNDNYRFLLSISKFPAVISQPGVTIKGVSLYSIGVGAQYRLYENLFLQVEAKLNLGIGGISVKQSCYYFTNNFTLNKSRRPIIVSPFAGYNRVLVTDANKSKKEIFYYWAGGVTAGLEITHKTCFYLSGSYNNLFKQTNAGAFTIRPVSASYSLGFAFKL